MFKKPDLQTRSTLSIDAVAKAAANAGTGAVLSHSKLGAVAGLAGFVLRLFRQKVSVGATRPGRARVRPGGTRAGYSRAAGMACGAEPARKGGRSHG